MLRATGECLDVAPVLHIEMGSFDLVNASLREAFTALRMTGA